MSEREQEQSEAGTSPEDEPQEATTPPGKGELDEEATKRAHEKLDQAGGGH